MPSAARRSMWGLDMDWPGTIAADIAIADIVGEQHDDVGLTLDCGGRLGVGADGHEQGETLPQVRASRPDRTEVT